MKSFGLLGAAFLMSANIATSIAGEVPAGGWREAACCQSNAVGQCVRWCDPPAGAVRGEQPEVREPPVVKEPPKEKSKDAGPKSGGTK